MSVSFQVWLTVEKWEGEDSKVCDIETELVATTLTEEEARVKFDKVQDALATYPEDF